MHSVQNPGIPIFLISYPKTMERRQSRSIARSYDHLHVSKELYLISLKGELIPIQKKNKKYYFNYRGISLLTIIARPLGTVFKNKIENQMEPTNPLAAFLQVTIVNSEFLLVAGVARICLLRFQRNYLGILGLYVCFSGPHQHCIFMPGCEKLSSKQVRKYRKNC